MAVKAVWLVAVAAQLKFAFDARNQFQGSAPRNEPTIPTLKSITWGVHSSPHAYNPANKYFKLFERCGHVLPMTIRASHFLSSSLLSGRGCPSIAPLSYRKRFQFAPNIRPAISLHRHLHSAIWPPLIFVNLLLTLWAYKVCDKEMRLIMV